MPREDWRETRRKRYYDLSSRAADLVTSQIQALAKAMVKGILGSFEFRCQTSASAIAYRSNLDSESKLSDSLRVGDECCSQAQFLKKSPCLAIGSVRPVRPAIWASLSGVKSRASCTFCSSWAMESHPMMTVLTGRLRVTQGGSFV